MRYLSSIALFVTRYPVERVCYVKVLLCIAQCGRSCKLGKNVSSFEIT